MTTIKLGAEEFHVGKIVCIGRNYAEHAKELGNEVPEFPLIFLKPPSNIIFSGDAIVHPEHSSDMHHEVELVLLIGNELKNASLEEADKSVIGYTVGLDMTLRDLQDKLKNKGNPWTLAKCFDGSAVLGNFVPVNEKPFSLSWRLKLFVNEVEKQNSELNKMIFKPAEIVQYISSVMKLEKGDLIYTGTPSGVGKANRGDKLNAVFESVASLEVAVK